MIRFVGACGLLLAVSGEAASQSGRFALAPDARSALTRLKATGLERVKVVILAERGQMAKVAERVRAMGGSVRFGVDRVDYLRAHLPLDSVLPFVMGGGIENAAVSRTIAAESLANNAWKDAVRQYTDSVRGAGSAILSNRVNDWPVRPLEETDWREQPLERPYDPGKENGVWKLRQAHPTYDGRGVRIAQLEWGIDLLAPEVGDSPALTLDGRDTRKVVDFVVTRDPTDPAPAPCCIEAPWVRMEQRVAAKGGTVVVGAAMYRAPRSGTFRFGVYDGGFLCRSIDPKRAEIGIELNTVPLTERCDFPVLWDVASGEVWVDGNRDGSFADEKPVRDYARNFDVGLIGRDDPATGPREAYGFAVKTRPQDDWVAIIRASDHAQMVASTAVGRRGTSGRIDGVAPGAQLKVYVAGGDIASVAEGSIAAMLDPGVDVVFSEVDKSGGDVVLGNGQSFLPMLVGRLAELTGKPFFKAGGNCNSDGCSDSMGAGGWTYSVGAMEARDAWWVNRAVRVAERDNNHRANAWGPGADGALLPTILAPSGFLASVVPKSGTGVGGRTYSNWNHGLQGLYHLPPGYGIGGGTSQATPSMAGAAAILLSAAKQARVPYDARRLWLAITNSARFSANLPAHQQGNGTVDVDAAFKLLQAYAKRPLDIRIVSSGPVRTAWSHTLPVAHRGVSLFEREGWVPGMSAEREVTLMRTSGPAWPMTFRLSWNGNDGTFAGPDTVTLPLNANVPVRLTVNARSYGYHSALLNLDHPDVPGHVHRMMVAVVAAKQFVGDTGTTLTVADTLARPGPGAYYFHVPSDAGSLDLRIGVEDPAGSALLHVKRPSGTGFWLTDGRTATTVANPEPGVWEVSVTLRNDGLALRKASTGAAVDPAVPIRIDATLSRQKTVP